MGGTKSYIKDQRPRTFDEYFKNRITSGPRFGGPQSARFVCIVLNYSADLRKKLKVEDYRQTEVMSLANNLSSSVTHNGVV